MRTMAGSDAPEVARSPSPAERPRVGATEALLAAASAVNGVADPEGALDQILASGLDVLGARRAAVVLEEDTVPDVALTVERGSWSDVGGPPDRSTSIVGHVRRTRASALGTLQVAEAPIRGSSSAGTSMAAPVEHRGELLGALVVEAARGEHFQDEQRVVLELLAVYVAAVLARWRNMIVEREQVAALLEADRMRREFAVIAGHELRTPVTVIRAAAAGARRPEIDAASLSELLDTIEQQAERFECMASEIAAEWRRVTRIRVALYDVDLADAIKTAAVEATGRGHPVRVSDEHPCPVWANRAVIRRVLALLIDALGGADETPPELSIERDARYAVVVLRLPPGLRNRRPRDRDVATVRGLVEACRGTVGLDGRDHAAVRIAFRRARGAVPRQGADAGARKTALVDAVPAPERATAPPPTPVGPREG